MQASETGKHSFRDGLVRPEFQRCYDYWRGKASTGGLPARSDIDPVEIPTLLPWVNLVDVVREGDRMRFRVRLVGTGIVDRFGRDATGLRFEDVYEGAILERQNESYGEVARSGEPRLWCWPLPVAGRESISYDRILLPLAGDGRTVDMIMGLFGFDDVSLRPVR